LQIHRWKSFLVGKSSAWTSTSGFLA
jgi:hypothetical protein